MKEKSLIKNILWTASDITLPSSIWNRIEGSGYKLLISESTEDTLAMIEKSNPSLWVGQTNGNPEVQFSNYDKIRTRFPELPIIILSLEPTVEEAVKAIKLGINDYISKEVSEERLWTSIEGALKFSTIPSSSLSPKKLPSKKGKDHYSAPIAVHSSMCKILSLAKRIAPSRSNVLIQGESGTGKEVIAQYIHKMSDRRDNPFIAVNCAALPENLLESELFGHEKGAFTGAVARKKGKFELADEGTLLLDEISEMAVSIQAKLLRVLQEREIDRVGGQFSLPVNTRVIATTNRDLDLETKDGNFRLDLYYRLNVVPLKLPPLRERPDDIMPLAEFFLKKHCEFDGFDEKVLSSEAKTFLLKKKWPGNVRELENLMERAILLIESDNIGFQDLEMISIPETNHVSSDMESSGVMPLRQMEKRMIYQALNDNSGNRTHAAKKLGISVRTLRNKLNEYQKELENEKILN